VDERVLFRENYDNSIMEHNKGMQELLLLNATGDERVDYLLKTIIATLEETFPRRIRCYYIEGSYANESQVATSDLDLVIIFKDSFLHEQERARAEELIRCYALLSGMAIDVQLVEEEHLRQVGVWPGLKMASVIVYGEDIREQLSLVTLPVWTRVCMHTTYERIGRLFHLPCVGAGPLVHPDPDGEFYGYDQHKIRLVDGSQVNCMRDLVHLAGWSATAMLALKAGLYVACRSDCQRLYTDNIADQWTAFLYDTYTLCRGRWYCLIPDDPGERRLLRLICSRMPGFANHFLQLYKDFLLRELQADEKQGKLQAFCVLSKLPYKDAEIASAVCVLEHDLDDATRAGAAETMLAYKR
jgi:predicted nucleotidyltransferase